MPDLRYLVLFTNKLTGAIPYEIGNLGNLEDLRLSDNLLTGSIPPEIRSLQELHTLWLSTNQLAGPIPKAIGNLGKLQELRLHANDDSLCLPEELHTWYDNLSSTNPRSDDFLCLLANPSFEDGTSPWKLHTNGKGNLVAGRDAAAGDWSAQVQLIKAGSNVQLFQHGISLQPDTAYHLRFAAKSSNGNE